MGLTAKQEAFCLAYVQSGSAVDAYRDAGYSPNMSSKTATEASSRLLKNSKVIARIAEIRAVAANGAAMTLEGHLDDLKALRDKATREGKYSAAVAAEVARGRASGFYVEKLEHSGEIKTPSLVLNLTSLKPKASAE